MKGSKPTSADIPTEDGGFQQYGAAGKLQGKKAIITGGDSGIGRAIAILFAMEGAESLITHLPNEEKDANEAKQIVEEKGEKCYLLPVDLKRKEDCRKVIDFALEKLGGINILVNNAGTQTQIESITDLSE
jgi:NAD(P)-dependent dehydrogenase (short-subunit alcohol dehydrogenase family)